MPKVLIVDDEPGVARALQRTLRGAFDVQVASCPIAALAMLETFAPDVVISDFKMPGMSGVELLSQVQQRMPLCVRVLLSGETDSASMEMSLSRGLVARFLHKPWDDDLAEVVAGILPKGEAA